MTVVTKEMEGKDLERILGKLGVKTSFLDAVETPQTFRFNFSGGWYAKTALRRAIDILNSRDGYTHEINPNGSI